MAREDGARHRLTIWMALSFAGARSSRSLWIPLPSFRRRRRRLTAKTRIVLMLSSIQMYIILTKTSPTSKKPLPGFGLFFCLCFCFLGFCCLLFFCFFLVVFGLVFS